MEIVTNIALISINDTLIAQLVSFLIFLFIINRVMIRPLRRIMSEREGYLGQLKQDIDKAKLEYEQVSETVRKEEFEARAEAAGARHELEAAGMKEAAGIVAAAQEEIEALRSEERRKLEAKVDEARRSIGQEAESLAVSIMEKVLDRRLAHE
jgi:F-type H+-transporting ATPase subunit b